MRKKKLLVALVFVLTVMVVLKCCDGKKEEMPDVPVNEQDVAEKTVQSDGTEAPLGIVAENANGGIIITLTKEDGTEETVAFDDVAFDSWYAPAVNYVVSMNLMKGAEGSTAFQPDYAMQRFQFAAVLYRLAEGTPENARHSFTDVDRTQWYYDYVVWITNHGYMNGKSDDTFDPKGYLSCEEALVVLYRLAGEPKPEGTLESYPYSPKVTSNGRDAVAWAWNNALINEEECVWYPTQAISRAQGAMLLMRYSEMMQE